VWRSAPGALRHTFFSHIVWGAGSNIARTAKPCEPNRAVAKSGRASEKAGVQGAGRPLPEREVSSLLLIFLPPQAAKRDFTTALVSPMPSFDKEGSLQYNR